METFDCAAEEGWRGRRMVVEGCGKREFVVDGSGELPHAAV
jgi:hypothetical protein